MGNSCQKTVFGDDPNIHQEITGGFHFNPSSKNESGPLCSVPCVPGGNDFGNAGSVGMLGPIACSDQSRIPSAMSNQDNGDSALIQAATFDMLELVICYVEQGADVNITNKDGYTALMKASQHGAIRIVKYLAEHCAVHVDARSNRGYTALLLAAEFRKIEVVRYLAGQCGADVNAKSGNGNTALMKAVAHENVPLVRYLVEECLVDVNVKNNQGLTAVRLASDRGYHEIRRILTPFLQPRLSMRTTSSAETDSPSPKYLASCSIPASEIELTKLCQNENMGGDFRAKWLDADVIVKLFISDVSHTTFGDEVRLWQQLRHPNVLKMYGSCVADPLVNFFVCEYASKGSLSEYVKASSPKKPTIWKYLYEAALGLEYLHERKIIHGDLCCSNILIGSDDLAKLSNFERSGTMKRPKPVSSGVVGSMRWQAPEVMKGGPLSFESDVYSLGMCILEAVTGKIPWSGKDVYVARRSKADWAPESNAASKYATSNPQCHFEVAGNLVCRMCSQDPYKRIHLAAVVYELESLAVKESSYFCQPQYEPCSLEEYNYGIMQDTWVKLQAYMKTCNNNQHYQAFEGIKGIHKCLQGSTCHPTVLARFNALLTEFFQTVKMSPEQSRLLRLSSTRATNSLHSLHWRIDSLLASLGNTQMKEVEDAKESEVRWQQQRSERVEQFMSGVSDICLLLKDLSSPEERSAFLRTLQEEIAVPTRKYSVDQLATMMQAYEKLSCSVETKYLSELAPEWFIPWYELIVDEWSCLGEGAFGIVNLARWLDSDVVVKRVILPGSGAKPGTDLSLSAMSASVDQSDQLDPAKKAEALTMFRREVDIWFGFSHPHVVRLFGACHVGRPFFVCEYATNGTLVHFLKKNPDQLWAKLHEAALGVQYLHARNVVHGDLKGNNIVVGSDLKAKVTDFGLSSIVSSEIMPLISAAWYWVAPECLADHATRPTFASDVYSLGMCIVEAMRVVEAVKAGTSSKHCLPWSNTDKHAVRFNALHGALPSRPSNCEDNQWELVKHMCALDPYSRIKISTVVDMLAELAGAEDKKLVNFPETEIVDTESASLIIAIAQHSLGKLQDDMEGDLLRVLSLYTLLWNYIEEMHGRLNVNDTVRTEFYSFVADAHVSTSNVLKMKSSLITLTEAVMKCYSLHRRLDKLEEVREWAARTDCLDSMNPQSANF